jgi:hypothetical protein
VDGDDLWFPNSALNYSSTDDIVGLTWINSITIQGGYIITDPGTDVGSLGLQAGMTVAASPKTSELRIVIGGMRLVVGIPV